MFTPVVLFYTSWEILWIHRAYTHKQYSHNELGEFAQGLRPWKVGTHSGYESAALFCWKTTKGMVLLVVFYYLHLLVHKTTRRCVEALQPFIFLSPTMDGVLLALITFIVTKTIVFASSEVWQDINFCNYSMTVNSDQEARLTALVWWRNVMQQDSKSTSLPQTEASMLEGCDRDLFLDHTCIVFHQYCDFEIGPDFSFFMFTLESMTSR